MGGGYLAEGRVVDSGDICAYNPLRGGYLGFVSNAHPAQRFRVMLGAAHDVRWEVRYCNVLYCWICDLRSTIIALRLQDFAKRASVLRARS